MSFLVSTNFDTCSMSYCVSNKKLKFGYKLLTLSFTIISNYNKPKITRFTNKKERLFSLHIITIEIVRNPKTLNTVIYSVQFLLD